MTTSYFITGTDTEVGKTFVSSLLLKAAAAAGLQSVGYKPVSAGCELVDGEMSNEDARSLHAASSLPVSLSEVNPIALMPPIAPHIAAAQVDHTITSEALIAGFTHLQDKQPDFLLMEGAGGWRLPLGNDLWMPDVVKTLKLDVIVVVGMRLGCLNHAMLTCEAIQHDGLNIRGWIANQLSPDMPVYQENLATLKAAMPAPLLAEIPYGAGDDTVAALHSLVHELR
ncbi:dethiobiotin synthase [Alteromonas confluentis]|uniref:ATP-dependent dethiobiotin synthetase BioD n=1 Tax=Alteromonas confluentis TaxID=1656094 RepID=A0A1E7Z7D4_9ALTE|nr:dethiobiotin synthase [Alteromonas confluentis]OFC69372.1 dethiobiotin synthase [Alteromonas confluentis]